jgi:hypothetical protein
MKASIITVYGFVGVETSAGQTTEVEKFGSSFRLNEPRTEAQAAQQ